MSRSLFIDVGNTRLKWATMSGDALQIQSPILHLGQPSLDVLKSHWQALPRPAEIWVSNVAGYGFECLITEACHLLWGRAPIFPKAQPQHGALLNGYDHVEQLGIDRWLGLISCHLEFPKRPLVLISAGSAITIDIINSHDQHLGGYILPGLFPSKLPFESFQVPLNKASTALSIPTNTASALQAGLKEGMGPAIEQIFGNVSKKLSTSPELVITGGDARELGALLSFTTACHRPDIVLKGLYAYKCAIKGPFQPIN